MSNPTFSLIIPHYSTPELLERLLFTVPNHPELQVIVVDDCTPNGNEVLTDLKDRYKWVEWHSTGCNGGGGKARNIGIEAANGEWIFFADADDYFTPLLHELLNEFPRNDNVEIIYFNACSTNSATYAPENRVNHLNNYIHNFRTNRPKGERELRYLFGEPWCKFVRKRLIERHHIRFEEIPIHNDTLFSYISGHYAQEINVDERVLYCVTYRPNSVSKDISSNKLLTRLSVFANKYRFIERQDIHFNYKEGLLITPFIIARKKGDSQLIKLLYDKAAEFGFSKSDIQRIHRSILLENILNKVFKRKS